MPRSMNCRELVFVNKMDKDMANFSRALGDIEKAFGSEGLPLQIPIGAGEQFEGIVDLIKMKAFKTDNRQVR